MRLIPLLALCLTAPALTTGQSVRGTITGLVHDSTQARPLVGASVMIAGLAQRTVTDSAGRFRLLEVPTGTVQLFFLHARLDTLGYTPRNVTVEITSSSTQEVLLALPSSETMAREGCGTENTTSRLLEGVVTTLSGGAPVANAEVAIRWRGGSAVDTTGLYGGYRFCALPARERIAIHASLLGRSSAQEWVSADGAAFVRRNIRLDFGGDATNVKTSLRASTGALQVIGHLRDTQSNSPIASAAVRLANTPFRALSNAQGGFAFAHVPAGDYLLEVEHLGYGKREQRFTLPPGASVDLEVLLAPAAIAVSGVTVRALTSEATERRSSGSASRVLGEAQLDAAQARGATMADVLRQHMTGLIIREGNFEATDSNLPQAILCVESKRGQVSITPQRTRRSAVTYPPCDMIPVFVDDSRLSAAGNFLRYTPLDIFVRIEYLPASAAALRYGLNSENKGALVLHTKRPGQRK